MKVVYKEVEAPIEKIIVNNRFSDKKFTISGGMVDDLRIEFTRDNPCGILLDPQETIDAIKLLFPNLKY